MSRESNDKLIKCQICGNTQRRNLRRALIIRPVIEEQIKKEGIEWNEDGWICLDDLQKYQFKYVQSLLEAEKGDLTQLEFEVLEGLREHEIFSRNPGLEDDAGRSVGQVLADKIAAFGGSWWFIITFAIILIAWMIFNSFVLISRAFDPFPYILLNLVLSTLAALQAPVIMMSQNRQESRDRTRALYDYKINLKAELEIRQLHQKIDHLLSHQWERPRCDPGGPDGTD